jgi:hypothetical protein
VLDADEPEELSEGEVLEPHAVSLPEDEPALESEAEPEPEWKPVDDTPASLDGDDAPTLVGAAAVAAASTEPRALRRPKLPSLPSLRGANINVSVGTFDPRVAVLVALIAVVGAAGLIVMRSGSSKDTSAPSATKSATPAPVKSSSAPATPAGYSHVVVDAGNYSVDVPTALKHKVESTLVTFSSSDQSRAYAVNGNSSDSTSLSAVAKRVVAGYRDSYRLSAVKVSGTGSSMRVTASGVRRGAGKSRQDMLAIVFRADSGKGTYVVQRFTRRGTPAPEAELSAVRASVKPGA